MIRASSSWKVAIAMGVAVMMGICFSADDSAASPVAAVVNGEAISAHELEKAFAGNLALAKKRTKVNATLARQLRARVLERLIDDKLLDQKARKMEMSVDDRDLDARLSALRGRFTTSDEYDAVVERAGVTTEDLRASVRSELLRERTIEQIAGRASVTDADVDRAVAVSEKRAKVPLSKSVVRQRLEAREREKQRASVTRSLRAAATIER